MEAEIISTIVNAGGQAVLLFILAQVWAELKAANQYTRDLLRKQQEADDERAQLLHQVESLQAYRAATEAQRRREKPNE